MQIFHYGNLSASTVLIQPVDDHDLEEMETELNEIRKQGKADFQLIAVKVDNWNQDLSPWEASAVFGREGFGDGAGELLQFLLGQCADRRKTYYIAGGIILSLGGISDGYLCRCCSSISVCLVSGISAIYERTRYESKVGVSELGKP